MEVKASPYSTSNGPLSKRPQLRQKGFFPDAVTTRAKNICVNSHRNGRIWK
ncbi:hypothetical protein OK016_05840 [Vibrio chagasii]|nr:hypothetical protein [Vibrio chagasii]